MVRGTGKRALFGQAVEASRLIDPLDNEGAANTEAEQTLGTRHDSEREERRCTGSWPVRGTTEQGRERTVPF